ncbi:MAG: hypothetical protein FJZ63_03590 [Chlamydiae bacterium]|nr:hypothetical protein [Chlamydiota bacterium]
MSVTFNPQKTAEQASYVDPTKKSNQAEVKTRRSRDKYSDLEAVIEYSGIPGYCAEPESKTQEVAAKVLQNQTS